ncbi:MAG: 50S ribosomal protein L16 [Candidatus Nanoarchaeia archaeon]|jgi:large subunit ribosomal protein L10e
MAKLRPAICYKTPKRPYTRVSKYKRASFVTGVPGSKIRKFDMGQTNGDFEIEVGFKCHDNIQIRHNALEAFRISANRNLEKKLGKNNYHLKLKIYPHHVMRHNPTANFAGADRFSSGMSHCFGKALGRAAIVKKDQMISFIRAKKSDLKDIKETFRIAGNKLGCKYNLEVKDLK